MVLSQSLAFMRVLVGCAWLCMVLAGSEPVVRPIFHFDMDTDDAAQTSARTDIQHPWLEYSVWQGREWLRIYTPGQFQLWHPDDEVPDLPENTFREWKRVLRNQAKHGLFEIGNIKDINGYCPAMSLSPPIMLRINHLLTCKIRT